MTVTPVAFITIHNGNTKLLQVDPFHSSLDRVIGMVPDVVDRITEYLDKKKEEEGKEIRAEKSKLVEDAPED